MQQCCLGPDREVEFVHRRVRCTREARRDCCLSLGRSWHGGQYCPCKPSIRVGASASRGGCTCCRFSGTSVEVFHREPVQGLGESFCARRNGSIAALCGRPRGTSPALQRGATAWEQTSTGRFEVISGGISERAATVNCSGVFYTPTTRVMRAGLCTALIWWAAPTAQRSSGVLAPPRHHGCECICYSPSASIKRRA